ncbi:MAG TPA: DUF3800 domain-containing protein [Bacteroidia bacterium]|nr:DUF3800 domain-containing protein [Bacteroidia bacterium]
MLLCYIDESGTPQLPGNTSHYVLAGLSIPIERWKDCEREVQKIKDKYKLTHAEIHTGWLIWPLLEQNKIVDFEKLDYAARKYEVEKYRNAELLRLQSPKTVSLYHKTKKNYRLTYDYIHLTYDQRKSFVKEIATLIGGWSFCRLFAECVDKLHFNPAATKLTVDEQAFEQIVSRFQQYLKIYSLSSKQKQYGLLIHDNNEAVSKKHTTMMKNFHQVGTFWTSIENIIETPLFVDSHLTSMVQLADVCGYAIRRYLEKKEDYLFNEIYKVADKKSSGKVVGVRHFTANHCSCKICEGHR